MIATLFPGFLLGGVGLAALATIMHFLARRPPTREALPTARFLREDARTLLRVQPRPTDVWVLLVRVVFSLSLGAAFSGMMWTPGRSGSAHIVLLDGGAQSESEWNSAMALARDALSAVTEPDESIIVVYGAEGGSRTVDLASLGSVVPGFEPASAEDGLRALRETVLSETRFSSVRAEWVLGSAWSAWNDGVGLMRPAVWPARLPLRTVPRVAGSRIGPVGLYSTDPPAVHARYIGLGADDVIAGLRALSVPVGEPGSDPLPGDWLFAEAPSPGGVPGLLDRARAGEVVIVAGRVPRDAVGLPWARASSGARARSGLVLPGFPRFGSGVEGLGGSPVPGASVLAVFADAAPAAASIEVGRGCVVYLDASLHDPALVRSSNYPEVLRALATGCDGGSAGGAPLDRGALASLERDDLPAVADVAGMGLHEGMPLSRWWLAFAFGLLMVEIAVTRKRRSA